MHDEHDAYNAALMVELGGVIRDARGQHAWTQRDLADAAGVHVNVVGSVERGRNTMRLSTLVQLAVALGTTSSDLLRESDRRVKAAAEGDGRAGGS